MILRNDEINKSYSYFTCDICNSSAIIETSEGWVCRECGIVFEEQKLQYDRPYNDDIIQYAYGIGRTQVGTNRERSSSPLAKELHRLNKQNSMTENREVIFEQARHEISRIFSCLNLTDYTDIEKMVHTRFKDVYGKLKAHTKYRNVSKLAAVLTYFCLKLRNISINSQDVINCLTITKKEFDQFILQVEIYLPAYAKRDRQEYILQRVYEIREHFDLGMPFYYQTKKILSRLWNGIKDASNNIIAGLVSSISILCMANSKISVNAICNRLGIKMSTVQKQVEKKIIDRFNIQGFVSLVRSTGLLRNIFENLEVIDVNSNDKIEQKKVELVFGNATEIFTYHDNNDFYVFALQCEHKGAVIVFVKIYHPLMNFEELKRPSIESHQFIEFEIMKYYREKDPPILEQDVEI